MRPLGILHITAPAAFGGLEHVVSALASGFAHNGHDVHLCAVLEGKDTLPGGMSVLPTHGVSLHEVRVPPRSYIRERRDLRALIAKLSPDVVHTHGYRADVIGGSVARGSGVPVVSTVHGFTGGGWRNRFYERLQLRALKRFSGVAAVSRSVAASLTRAGLPGERLHVIPNAWTGGVPARDRVAAREQLGLSPDHVHIGWIGRLSPEKGCDVAMDALALLDDPGIHLSIIGSGADQANLRERAARLGIAERVRWHGFLPDAARVLSAFDIFVLSSRTEGTPIVLFEAIEAGVPVVTTAVGGVPDMVGDDEAILVEPGSAAALARGIRTALGAENDTVLRRSAAAVARIHSQFASGPWLARYEQLYRSLVSDTAAAA